MYIYVYSLQIGDSVLVISIFIVSMDFKVWHKCFVARGRHQIGAVAHKVVSTSVKGVIMWVPRCDAC